MARSSRERMPPGVRGRRRREPRPGPAREFPGRAHGPARRQEIPLPPPAWRPLLPPASSRRLSGPRRRVPGVLGIELLLPQGSDDPVPLVEPGPQVHVLAPRGAERKALRSLLRGLLADGAAEFGGLHAAR